MSLVKLKGDMLLYIPQCPVYSVCVCMRVFVRACMCPYVRVCISIQVCGGICVYGCVSVCMTS